VHWAQGRCKLDRYNVHEHLKPHLVSS
jgi:hypothetical protein